MSTAVQDNKEVTENAEVKNKLKAKQSAETSSNRTKNPVKHDIGTLYYDCKIFF